MAKTYVAMMGDFVGTVKSYNSFKGWGFVQCPEAKQLYQKEDILFQGSSLNGCSVAPGDQVSFNVTQGRNGPLAVDLQIVTGQAFQGQPLGREEHGDTFSGTIKSHNPQKGYGFIACSQTEEIYGKDIIVLTADLQQQQVDIGQPVFFSVTQGRKGPIATNVQAANAFRGGRSVGRPRPAIGGDGAARQKGAFGGGFPQLLTPSPGILVQRPLAGPAFLGPGSPLAPQSSGPEQHCGVVKSFDEQKGWGFITGPELGALFGKDVYVGRAALRDQAVAAGTQVMFTMTMGLKGPMANDVLVLPPETFRDASSNGTVFQGVIKSFNVEKGWGFVTSPEMNELFGKDLFLHKRELPGGDFPQAGEEVEFVVQLNRQSQPEASLMVAAGPAAAAASPAVAAFAPHRATGAGRGKGSGCGLRVGLRTGLRLKPY